MAFFLHEIAARIVAIVLGVWAGRDLWFGFVNRRISSEPDDLVGWLLSMRFEFRRDSVPMLYWVEIVLRVVGLLACLFVAAFGWS